MKIAAVGFSCIDIYENLGISYPTGNGIDCILNLRKRGIPASAVSVVGTDGYGKEMLDTLQDFGVDISHMQVKEGSTSIFRMELRGNNDRVHLENIEGVMKDYAPTAEDIAFIQQHEYVHTDLFGKVLHLLPAFKEKGAKIIFDFSQFANEENMSQLLPYIDYAFFSVGEGNEEKALALLKRGKELGGSVMTATLGIDGSVSYDGENFYHGDCEEKEAKVVNTVGAGDSFIAGFTYGVMQGMPIPDCMKEGAKLAAKIIQIFNPY